MDDGFPDFSFAFAHGGTSSPSELNNHKINAASPASSSSSAVSFSEVSWGTSWGSTSQSSQSSHDESPFFQPSPTDDSHPFFPEAWAPQVLESTKPAVPASKSSQHKHTSSINIQWQPWKTPARANKLIAPGTFRLQPIEKATIVQRRTTGRYAHSAGVDADPPSYTSIFKSMVT